MAAASMPHLPWPLALERAYMTKSMTQLWQLKQQSRPTIAPMLSKLLLFTHKVQQLQSQLPLNFARTPTPGALHLDQQIRLCGNDGGFLPPTSYTPSTFPPAPPMSRLDQTLQHSGAHLPAGNLADKLSPRHRDLPVAGRGVEQRQALVPGDHGDLAARDGQADVQQLLLQLKMNKKSGRANQQEAG